MTDAPAKRPRGRPRAETTRATAQAARRTRQAAEGGSLRQFRLSPEATSALAAIRSRDGDASDRAVIERLLITGAQMDAPAP